jgi:hypothetical protein
MQRYCVRQPVLFLEPKPSAVRAAIDSRCRHAARPSTGHRRFLVSGLKQLKIKSLQHTDCERSSSSGHGQFR